MTDAERAARLDEIMPPFYDAVAVKDEVILGMEGDPQTAAAFPQGRPQGRVVRVDGERGEREVTIELSGDKKQVVCREEDRSAKRIWEFTEASFRAALERTRPAVRNPAPPPEPARRPGVGRRREDDTDLLREEMLALRREVAELKEAAAKGRRTVDDLKTVTLEAVEGLAQDVSRGGAPTYAPTLAKELDAAKKLKAVAKAPGGKS